MIQLVVSYAYQGGVYDEYLNRIDTPGQSAVFLERVPGKTFRSCAEFVDHFRRLTPYFPMRFVDYP